MAIYNNLQDEKKDIWLKKGIVVIDTEINPKSMKIATEDLTFIDDKLKPNESITIMINSGGGDMYAGSSFIAIMDEIKEKRVIKTCCYGRAMSMGLGILINGTTGYRQAHYLSLLMYHQHSCGMPQADASYLALWADFSQKLKHLHLKYEEERTNQSYDKLKQIGDRDFFMTAYEAKEHGFIDHVVKFKEYHYPKIDKRKKMTYEEWQNITKESK